MRTKRKHGLDHLEWITKKKNEEISRKKWLYFFFFILKSLMVVEKRIFQILNGLDTNSFNYKKKTKPVAITYVC